MPMIALSVREMLSPAMILYVSLLCFLVLVCYGRDSIGTSSSLVDSERETLVSSGRKFELGFFTPNGSSRQRYVGIWYYNSNHRTIVWVANRDNPVLDHTGVFFVSEDGNLKVIDGNGRSFWSTDIGGSASTYSNRIVKLLDSGNLVVGDEDSESKTVRVLWQSFENPTDTFLPGMKMDENMSLISWRSYNDPASGNFFFQLDQVTNQFVIWRRSVRYWGSGVSVKGGASSEMPSAIFYYLSNFTSNLVHNDSVPYITSSLYTDTRMLMSFSGQIQYLKWDTEKIWSLIWEAPRTRCGFYNACGNFGSCNRNNQVECNCLPGFHPVSPEDWGSGDYSGGCSRRSAICSNNSVTDEFLDLKMVKVKNPDSHFKAQNETECKTECLSNCMCQAFSYEEGKNTELSSSDSSATCWIWSDDLRDLQEEYDGGRNLSVRISISDIDSKPRSCGTCGTNIIPYPLSSRPQCGDPTYFNFYCNISSGQLNFIAARGSYKVTRISQELHKLAIQTEVADICRAVNSNGKFLQLNKSSPFYLLRQCNTDVKKLSSDVTITGENEVEIGWLPPLEPPCLSWADCKYWPNSTCSSIGNGQKKCLCDSGFQWDGLNLNCRKDHFGKHLNGSSVGRIPLAVIILIASISVIVFLVFSGTVLYTCLRRRGLPRVYSRTRGSFQRHLGLHVYGSQRIVKDMINSGSFHEDETEVTDVPFFNFESILAATNNFSNVNKLGQGGFGPVYKATFPGGEEIAVKRLSSGSGQGLEEFKNEVLLIAKLQHRNLVRLLGYCLEGEEKMLLYEYMPNKSLDSFIFDRKLCVLLNWDMRYNIIVGIARGLLYLHQDSHLRIIHRDLKTSNILLDEEMNPKISDFGLARTFGGKETSANTKRVVGTYGYIAPEYALDGLFSFKSDVFSFGVVVLEIISGKRNTGCYLPEQSSSLLAYAWNLWKEEKTMELLDPTLSISLNKYEFLKCINIGLLCVQEDPSDRPTMSNVVFMLGTETAVLPNPKQPAFVLRRYLSSSRASSSSKPETCSNNMLTVTLEDGR